MAEAQAHASLGYIYELLRNTDKAIDHYEQVCVWGGCTTASLP